MTMRTDHMPAIVCRPWCSWADGHPTEAFREDQYCATAELFVELSDPGEMLDVFARPGDEPAYTPERLHVYGFQRPDDDTPRISVNVDGGAAPDLTATEARELIEALQLVLGQVGA